MTAMPEGVAPDDSDGRSASQPMLATVGRRRRVRALRIPRLGREDLVLVAIGSLTAGCVLSRSRPNTAELQVLLVFLAAGAAGLAQQHAVSRRSSRAAWAATAGMCALLLPAPLLPTWAALAAGALVAAAVLLGGRAGLLIIVAALALIWTWPFQQTGCPEHCQQLWAWGSDRIDVFQQMQGSATAFVHGHDPYGPVVAILVPAANGSETFASIHLNYWPGIVLLSAPAAALGDVRAMGVVMVLLVGGALAMLARRGGSTSSELLPLAALYLASPFLPFMTLYSWNDVYAMAGFCWWIALRGRHDRWATVALAAAVVCKPTIAAAIVPFAIWSPVARRQLCVAVASAVAIALPFAAWTGPSRFLYDVVGVNFDPAVMVTRIDSLSLDAVLFSHGTHLPAWLPFPIVAGMAVLLLRRPPRGLPDLLLPGAVLTIVGLTLARQAFFNYYFVAFTLLLLALAGREVEAGELRAIWERPLAAWHLRRLAVPRGRPHAIRD